MFFKNQTSPPNAKNSFKPENFLLLYYSNSNIFKVCSYVTCMFSHSIVLKNLQHPLTLMFCLVQKTMSEGKDYCDRKINLLKSNYEELIEVCNCKSLMLVLSSFGLVSIHWHPTVSGSQIVFLFEPLNPHYKPAYKNYCQSLQPLTSHNFCWVVYYH